MKGFLLDTNVPSELIRLKPEPRVVQWIDNAKDELLHLSVVTIGEVYKGLTTHPDQRRRLRLLQWVNQTLRTWFADRILPVQNRLLSVGEFLKVSAN